MHYDTLLRKFKILIDNTITTTAHVFFLSIFARIVFAYFLLKKY